MRRSTSGAADSSRTTRDLARPALRRLVRGVENATRLPLSRVAVQPHTRTSGHLRLAPASSILRVPESSQEDQQNALSWCLVVDRAIETSRTIIGEGLLNLFLGVHHKRPILNNSLFQRAAGNEQCLGRYIGFKNDAIGSFGLLQYAKLAGLYGGFADLKTTFVDMNKGVMGRRQQLGETCAGGNVQIQVKGLGNRAFDSTGHAVAATRNHDGLSAVWR